METRSGSAVLPRSDPFHSLSNTPVPSEEVIHSFLRLVVCVFGVKDLSPAVRVGACVCLCQIRTSCFFLEGRGGRKRSRWMIREAFCVWFGSVRFGVAQSALFGARRLCMLLLFCVGECSASPRFRDRSICLSIHSYTSIIVHRCSVPCKASSKIVGFDSSIYPPMHRVIGGRGSVARTPLAGRPSARKRPPVVPSSSYSRSLPVPPESSSSGSSSKPSRSRSCRRSCQ